MSSFSSNRLSLALLYAAILFASIPQLHAQEDSNDAPLGDVARSLRQKKATPETVIDNDNLPKVMESAETRRTSGSSPVFSLDPGGKTFKISSPDVMCSLSFTAKTSALLSDPIMLDDLPRDELAKLNGPATIEGDSLQVSMYNGSAWQLREVVIGLTILRRPAPGDAAFYGRARILPAVAGAASEQASESLQKQPDVTLLLRVKGSAAPATTAIFRTSLNFALFPDQEWHWAIVKAKGVPPQLQSQTLPLAETNAGQTAPASIETTPQAPPATSPPSLDLVPVPESH